MEGIEKIAAKIREDAQAEADRITAQAREEADQILAQAQAQGEQAAQTILERGQRSAQERQERLSSAAQMEGRKLELAEKQALLDRAFQMALDRLCALPREEYVKLLADLLKKAAGPQGGQVIFSPADREGAGEEALELANKELSGRLTLSPDTRPIRGGFVLLEGNVELNCTFDSLVSLQREKLERDVARMLFD